MYCLLIAIDCLLVALDAHMFSHNGYGPGTKDQCPKAAEPGPAGSQLWALGPGPGLVFIMGEHIRIKGNQQTINRQSSGHI